MRKNETMPAGFTLIELLLVLSITALLLSLAPALIHKAFPVLKLKAAARDLVQEIRYIQNAAIINGNVADIQFDIENGKYRSDLVNDGKVRALPAGLSLSLDQTTPFPTGNMPTRFVFYPDGSSSGGTIFLGIDRKRLEIQVDWLTSKIQVNDPQATL
ncbi:MAG: prepilin-type N-terminal cleavage/methylation domain-containing protein [Candidatus Thiodiazotropha sp. (ex Monitilora ramsayi)]|nr:prepilin-type N-terminal cleavage/methylation domain-containing protein [Candidatus Thiodiazotropha sp. (ex Monitilora ramsayi)]